MTRTFSPRRAVSRSSIAAWASVAASDGGGPAHGGGVRRRSRADELEVGLLERGRRPRAARRSAGRRPRTSVGERRDQRRRPARRRRRGSAPPSASATRRRAAVERRRGAPPSDRGLPRVERPDPAGTAAAAATPAASSAGVPDATIRPPSRMHDPVGEPLDVAQVVARQQDRDARGPQVRDDRPGGRPRLGVHARPSARRGSATSGRPTRASASPSRCRSPPDSRRYACPRHAAEADQVEQLVGVARVGVEAAVLDEGLARLGARIDAAALEHQPDPRPQGPAAARRIVAEDPDRAAVGAPVALDDLDRRRLAGAVRAEEGDELAGARPSARRRRGRSGRRSAWSGRRRRWRGRGRPRPASRPSRADPRSRRDQGVLALEVGVGQLADLDRAEDPGAVDEVGLRPGGHAIGGLDRLVGVDDGRPGRRRIRRRSRGRARADRRSGRRRSRGRRRACSASLAASSGNSSRQGTHDGPQKLTTTGRPRRSARSNGSPSRVVPTIAGAGSPTRGARPRRLAARATISDDADGRQRDGEQQAEQDRPARHGRAARLLERGGPGHVRDGR